MNKTGGWIKAKDSRASELFTAAGETKAIFNLGNPGDIFDGGGLGAFTANPGLYRNRGNGV